VFLTVSNDAPIPLIDVWTNPASQGLLDNLPEIRRLLKQSGADQRFTTGLTPAQVVKQMDAAGIQRAFVTAWYRPGGAVVSNDEVARYVEAFPDRFVGIAGVDLEKPVEAVRELERVVRQFGFKALRLIPWLWNRPPNDKLYYPLFVKCIELGIPFCTQVGHTGPLFPSETGRPIPYIDEIALTFPELRIVGGHIGYPWTDEMIALAWKHANVYIDTSAYLPKYYPPQLVHYMSSYGKEKVLFATNFPMLDYQRCAEQARGMGLRPEVAKRFFYENAKAVFQLD
jgi:predicted TIM-barrel fold metal-dependent hydrolase